VTNKAKLRVLLELGVFESDEAAVLGGALKKSQRRGRRCEQINFSSTSLKVHLNITDAAINLQLDKQHTLLIYRMVQELVNNAMKYAQAKNIHINMDCEKNQLKLHLTDDGVGFDINALEKKDGLGIRSIKERVQQLIGTLQLTSNIGKGTQFNISIPV